MKMYDMLLKSLDKERNFFGMHSQASVGKLKNSDNEQVTIKIILMKRLAIYYLKKIEKPKK